MVMGRNCEAYKIVIRSQEASGNQVVCVGRAVFLPTQPFNLLLTPPMGGIEQDRIEQLQRGNVVFGAPAPAPASEHSRKG